MMNSERANDATDIKRKLQLTMPDSTVAEQWSDYSDSLCAGRLSISSETLIDFVGSKKQRRGVTK